jgi:hypothetical protein
VSALAESGRVEEYGGAVAGNLEGSVSDELGRLAKTIDRATRAREAVRVEAVALQDRISPILDVVGVDPTSPSLVAPSVGYAARNEIAREVRRLSLLLDEILDAFDQEIADLRSMRERVAL